MDLKHSLLINLSCFCWSLLWVRIILTLKFDQFHILHAGKATSRPEESENLSSDLYKCSGYEVCKLTSVRGLCVHTADGELIKSTDFIFTRSRDRTASDGDVHQHRKLCVRNQTLRGQTLVLT